MTERQFKILGAKVAIGGSLWAGAAALSLHYGLYSLAAFFALKSLMDTISYPIAKILFVHTARRSEQS